MIDIHSHIMPAVDDGAASLEESLEMLKIASQDGVKAIAVTPHVFQAGRFIDFGEKQHNEYRRCFNELKEKAKEQKIAIEILSGAELFFATDLREQLEHWRAVLTLNNSDYFLLEFPHDLVFPGSKEYLFDLVSAGFTPIICHPERNLVFQQHPRLLYRLLQVGVLAQLDAGSIRGDFGQTAYDTAMILLGHNLIHVIASDCHDTRINPPGLSFIYKRLHEIEKEKIDLLVEKVPLAIVNNNALPDTGPLQDPTRKTTFFDLFRRSTC